MSNIQNNTNRFSISSIQINQTIEKEVDGKNIKNEADIYYITSVKNTKKKLFVNVFADGKIECNCSEFIFKCYKNQLLCKHCRFVLFNTLKMNETNVSDKCVDIKVYNEHKTILINKLNDSQNNNNICKICLMDLKEEKDLYTCCYCDIISHTKCVNIWNRCPNCINEINNNASDKENIAVVLELCDKEYVKIIISKYIYCQAILNEYIKSINTNDFCIKHIDMVCNGNIVVPTKTLNEENIKSNDVIKCVIHIFDETCKNNDHKNEIDKINRSIRNLNMVQIFVKDTKLTSFYISLDDPCIFLRSDICEKFGVALHQPKLTWANRNLPESFETTLKQWGLKTNSTIRLTHKPLKI